MRTHRPKALSFAGAILILSLATAQAQPNRIEEPGGPGRAEVALAGLVAILSATLLLRRGHQSHG